MAVVRGKRRSQLKLSTYVCMHGGGGLQRRCLGPLSVRSRIGGSVAGVGPASGGGLIPLELSWVRCWRGRVICGCWGLSPG